MKVAQMTNFFESDDIHYDDDLFGGPSSQDNTEKDFKPWHKPRKQFMRDKQWWESLKRLITSSKYKDISEVKYFGLPGSEFLDIRHFLEKIDSLTEEKKEDDVSKSEKQKSNFNKKLSLFGLYDNKRDYEDALISIVPLKGNKYFSDDFKLLQYDFCAIENNDSLCYRNVAVNSPFHIVNLDFCDNALKDKTLSSIFNLLQLQFSTFHNKPWLLCITTRSDSSAINDRLFDILKENYNQYKDEEHLNAALLENIESLYNQMELCKKLDDYKNLDIINETLQVLLIIWILKSAESENIKVEVTSSMKYLVHAGKPDMYSYVFKFTSTGSKKHPFSPQKREENINLTTQSAAALGKFSRTLDVDNHLNENPDLKQKYTNEIKRLLKSIGYNVDNYNL